MTPYPVRLDDLMRRRPMTRVSLDAEGIPVYRYGGFFDKNTAAGRQRNTVIIGWWALAALERGDQGEFLRLARWMLADLKSRPDGSAAWEFGYPYAIGPLRVQPPFTGAQALGVGLSVLARAHAFTGEAGFLESGLRTLTLFRTPSSAGGVLHPDPRGDFYGVQGAPVAVFDGIAFACLGLEDFAQEAASDEAGTLARQGAAVLELRFDEWVCCGDWSRMWIGGPPASTFYHTLNARTARAVGFGRAAARWERGLSSPLVRARAWVGEKRFSLSN